MTGKQTPATKALDRAGVRYELHEYRPQEPASSYGTAAAAALGIEARRMFKTLVAEVDGTLCIGVLPVCAQLNLKALAGAVGGKRARMAEGGAAQRATGYLPGGIAPLGHRKQIDVLVDESAEAFETVYCSAGRRGLALELAPAALVRAAGAGTAALCG